MGKQHTKEYDNYIRSDVWQNKREERLKIDNNKCVMCGRTADRCRNGLQCHHVRYYRDGQSILGQEDPLKDLCSLCSPCHQKLHNYYNRRQ